MEPLGRMVSPSLRCALALLVVALAGACAGDEPVDEPDDLEARRVLPLVYDALGGSDWTNQRNWGTDAPLNSWYGVTTDYEGYIIRLDLRANRLTGSIPGELGMLKTLRGLMLGINAVGGPIPPELGNLANLVTLDLDYNQLAGPIPPELGQLLNLKTLSLIGNQLGSSIPPELGNLEHLVRLSLNSSRVTGSVPPELGNLRTLTTLTIHYNQMADTLPVEMVTIPLTKFWWRGSGLCSPSDSVFQAWLATIGDHWGDVACSSDPDSEPG